MGGKSPSLRVLVVDDEPLIRWSIAETMSRDGHSVVQAADGSSALKAVGVADKPFDAIVLDYRLPDSDDFTLLATIRRLSPSSVVVLVTAHGSPDIAKGALARGVAAVVNKPFDVHHLAQLLVESRR